MAKAIEEYHIVPLLFQRWEDEFKAPGWAKPLDNPFGLTNIISALLDEAGARGMGVIVQVSLCPLEWFHGPAPAAPENPTPQTGETTDDKED